MSVCLVFALVISMTISPALVAQSHVVPRGTTLKLILNEDLSTEENEVGDRFSATLAEDVRLDERTLIRRGATVEGTITELERPKRFAGLRGRASMTLRFDRIRTDQGSHRLDATLVSVHDPVPGFDDEDIRRDRDREDEDIDVGEEGEIEAEPDVGEIITKGAIGVAAGALLGALFGNVSRGLILGSIGGAVAILAPKGKHVELEEGTGLRIRLDRDLNLSIT
jgi:hypothetical protein